MSEKLRRTERADGINSRRTILNAAARLATIEGLEGLSIGKLAEHIGMSKSGLYAHFGSKEELQLATIETAQAIFQDVVVDPTLSIEDPVERIEALCDSFLGHLERRVFPGGCFFAAVSAEFDTRPGAVQTRITEVQDEWLATFVELGERAKALGLIEAREDPQQLAFEIDSYLLMANMNFVLHNNVVSLERARTAVQFRLGTARRGPRETGASRLASS
jgi:AcrR family transcriptional regulator